MAKKSINQYGDFQTPIHLARQVIATLERNHDIKPDIIVEPSCGKGSFIQAALEKFTGSTIFGFDINPSYVEQAKQFISNKDNIQTANFFNIDWKRFFSQQTGCILILGNPPWVTNSDLGIVNSQNLPNKLNIKKDKGIQAITGASNFDISEWMLLQYINWLKDKQGLIAILCKYTVARKFINYNQKYAAHIYPIDTKYYFNVDVEACLFVLDTRENNQDCKIYKNINATTHCHTIGMRNNLLLNNIQKYEKWQHLQEQDSQYIWRSGIKHDCAKVMELEPIGNQFKNGLQEQVYLEQYYLYPLLKSSDVGNGRVNTYRKMLLVTQQNIGEKTDVIKIFAPYTWQYLLNHRTLLNKRRSRIYHHQPEFSIFGVGTYSFKPWKIAISGLYKKLHFHLIAPLDNKPVVFDDTVNFLSFDSEEEAKFIYSLVTSKPALEFLDAMIFWEDKRPITTNILCRLHFKRLAQELDLLEQYQYFIQQKTTNHQQLELTM
jgi:hypothetical protein